MPYSFVLLHDSQRIFLLEEGMQLHLIDGGDDFHVGTQVHQYERIEIGNTDCLRETFLICFCNASVSREVIAHCLMKQDQVHVRHVQFLKRCLHCLISRIFGFHVGDPDLGGDEKLFPVHQAISDGTFHAFSKCLFIAIGSGSVQQSVSCFDCIVNNLFAFGSIRDLENSETLQSVA